METNGLTIPDSGATTQYIPDVKGGWVYKITSNVVVEQIKIADFKEHVEDAKRQIIALQDLVATTEPIAIAVEDAQPAPIDGK